MHRERVQKTLEVNLGAHKNHLTTGFLGTPYLCHCLSENGNTVIIAIIALFCIPADASANAKTGYALVTNIFASAIVYTAIAIPYGALMAVRTKSTDERSKMGIFRALFGYIIGMIIAIALIPITNMLGGNQRVFFILGQYDLDKKYADLVREYEERKKGVSNKIMLGRYGISCK